MTKSRVLPDPSGFNQNALVGVADFNRDGKPDLVILGVDKVAFYFNLGGGVFDGPHQVSDVSIFDFPLQMAIGDIDGDGLPDLAFIVGRGAPFPGHISVMFYREGSSLDPQIDIPTAVPGAILMSDLNHDRLADIVTFSGGSTMSVFLATGDGGLAAEQAYSVLNSASDRGGPLPQAVTADFNADGIPDLAVLSYADTTRTTPGVTLVFNDGHGGFQGAKTFLAVPADPNSSQASLGVGDFNGDGFPDLVVGSNGAGIDLLLSTGRDTFAAPVHIPQSNGVGGIAVADFNGDGWPDVVLGSLVDGTFNFLINAGGVGPLGGVFLPFITLDTGQVLQYWEVHATDLNGDGAADLFFPEIVFDPVPIDGVAIYFNGCP